MSHSGGKSLAGIEIASCLAKTVYLQNNSERINYLILSELGIK